MKKIFTVLLLFFIAGYSLFANSSWSAIGIPENPEAAILNVGFIYDPDTMHRLTFGFTQETDLDWFDVDGNLDGKVMYLETRIKPNEVDYGCGTGVVNFFWKLKTPDAISAKLYLQEPLKEESGAKTIDWGITVDAKIKDLVYHDVELNSKYGIDSAIEVFSKEASPEMPVIIDYIPVTITTAYTRIAEMPQTFKGVIGTVIEVI